MIEIETDYPATPLLYAKRGLTCPNYLGSPTRTFPSRESKSIAPSTYLTLLKGWRDSVQLQLRVQRGPSEARAKSNAPSTFSYPLKE